MAARRERVREGRRQSDPSFPLNNTQPASTVTRPPPPTPSSEGHLAASVNGKGVLKEPRSKNKKKSGKGLRVTFDLDSISEYCKYSKAKEETVINSWEDISDCEAETSGTRYAIRDEDLIDCDRELQLEGIGGDCIHMGGDPMTWGHIGAASDTQDYSISTSFIGSPVYASIDHDAHQRNVPDISDTGKLNTNFESISAFSEEETPVFVNDDNGLTASAGNASLASNVKLNNKQSYDRGNGRNIIPFIDSSEEETCEGNEDDKWETEPSGNSSETVGENHCLIGGDRSSEAEEWQNVGPVNYTVVVEPSLIEDYGDDSDDLITKEDLQAVFLALMEDQENEHLPIDLSDSPIASTKEEAFEGEIQSTPDTKEILEAPIDRGQSPMVSIGYECHDRKSATAYGSETESEGELVPCEDKCVGTSDHSDDEPLDLSVSEKPLIDENEVQKSRHGSDCKELTTKPDKEQLSPTTVASGEDVSEGKLGDLSPSPEVPEDGKCIGNSESSKEKEKINGKKGGKKKGKKNKREAKTELVVKPTHILERPKLVRGKTWKEKTEKFKAHHGDALTLSPSNSPDLVSEDTPPLVSEDTPRLVSEDTPPLVSVDTPLVSVDTPPLVSEDTRHLVSVDTPPLVSEDTPPMVAEDIPPLVPEHTPPLVSEHTPPLVSEDTRHLVSEHTPPLVSEDTRHLVSSTSLSTDTTTVAETPCTHLSAISGKETESESLDSECDDYQVGNTTTLPRVTEVGSGDDGECHTPTVTEVLPGVAIHVTGGSGDESDDSSSGTSPAESDDFYIVKACTLATPSEVLTEYVVDSESSEEASLSQTDDISNREQTVNSENGAEIINTQSLTTYYKDEPNGPKQNGDPFLISVSESEDHVYFDAQPSLCTDNVSDHFDYVQSFPDIVGTQRLNLVYTYDTDSDIESNKDGWSCNAKERVHDSAHDPSSAGVSGLTFANVCEDAKISPLISGEIIYEGPCSCGPNDAARISRLATDIKGNDVIKVNLPSNDEQLCVPPLLGDEWGGVLLGDGVRKGVESQAAEQLESELKDTMKGSPEESCGDCDGNSKDIRSRINEIVGPRLQRERTRPAGVNTREEEAGGVPADDHHAGRDDSPLPGSSPASSSGVQGSDEMSLSRSRSQSPPREESASPVFSVPDLVYESYQVQELLPEKLHRDATEGLRALRLEGSVESSPEKVNQVDYSFRTFRDMYQINPIYLTDSDEHDDQNESDTVVPGSLSLSYDPERSITVTSWASTSDESPAPLDTGTTPPLPGAHATRKVPKVTRLLRETQGIVQRWEVLQAQAVERQRQSGQVRELQRQVKTLRQALEALTDRANELTQADDVSTHQQLNLKLQEAKILQQEVSARKKEVSSINLAVHRFLTDTGYSLAPLKDDVADLYRIWDEADRRLSSEVSRLEGVEDAWKRWETQAEELTRALRQDGETLKVLDTAIQTGSLTDTETASVQGVARLLNDKRKTQPGKKLLLQHTKAQGVDIQGSTLSLRASGDECLSDSGTSGYESCSSEELSERELRLVHLRRLARDLEASLHPNSQAWAAICKTLSSAETELKGLQKHCRELVVRSAESLDHAKTSPQLRRRSWTRDNKVGRGSRRGNNIGGMNGRRGWMWRVVRAALPFQAALLLLFCVACLLEPNCCDHVNTLNLSLSPQVRYVHGPPPV